MCSVLPKYKWMVQGSWVYSVPSCYRSTVRDLNVLRGPDVQDGRWSTPYGKAGISERVSTYTPICPLCEHVSGINFILTS